MADDSADSNCESEDSLAGPVPRWAELPDYAQSELAKSGYDGDWFTAQTAVPELRLTVLNLYVKLRGLGLWRFITREQDTVPGGLHFHCSAIAELKANLRASADFTSPRDSVDTWQSREKRAVGALHFKHFTGWPEQQVQAHIDPRGLLLHSLLWWIVPIIPLGQMLAHAVHPTGYTKVYRIRDILLAQGWDEAPLIGARQRIGPKTPRRSRSSPPCQSGPKCRLHTSSSATAARP